MDPDVMATAVDRTRWNRSAATGGLAGLLLQVWMLTAGTGDFLRWGRQSDFYDVQARALLDGTLAMDQRVLGIESFARGDQHFMYFGPVPALLRLPVVAFTRGLDGRLAALSMLAALGVMLVAVMRLGWRLRQRIAVAGDTSSDTGVSRFESLAVGLTMFAIVGGSSLLYASSRTWVYHEAILWGVALTLASLAALLAWCEIDDLNSWPAHQLMIGASTLAMLALLTRPSVAGGALAALALAAVTAVVTAPIRPTLRTLALLASAIAMPVGVYSVVNWLKFRRLLGVPFDKQGYTLLSEQRREMLAANGGSLFNVKFVPTNLMSYLRPDLVGVDGTFPFVQPRRPATTIGSPVYDLIDLSSGVPTTMPLLCVLALVGGWAVVRRRDRPLAAIIVGCSLGTVAVLAIGYIANRYQSDFLPLLVVAALAGLPVITRWVGHDGSPRRAAALSGCVILVTVGTLTNLALGYSYQRAYGPSTHPDVVAGYVDAQRRVDEWLGDGRLAQISRVDDLPASSKLGDVAVVGDCAALYISDGGAPAEGRLTQWRLAELSPARGAAHGSVVIDADAAAAIPLVHVRTGKQADAGLTVIVEVDERNGLMTVVAATPDDRQRGPDLAVRSGERLAWQLFADPILGRLELYLDGRFALFTELPVGADLDLTVGRNIDGLPDVIDDATNRVVSDTADSPAAMPVCRSLIDDTVGR